MEKMASRNIRVCFLLSSCRCVISSLGRNVSLSVVFGLLLNISTGMAQIQLNRKTTQQFCLPHLNTMLRDKRGSDAWNNQIFFLLCFQRSALSVAANCCHSIGVGDFHLVADSIPILSGRLQHQVTQKTHRAANNSWSLENFWLACKESSVR